MNAPLGGVEFSSNQRLSQVLPALLQNEIEEDELGILKCEQNNGAKFVLKQHSSLRFQNISSKRPSINYVVSKLTVFDPFTLSLLSFYYIKSVIFDGQVVCLLIYCVIRMINEAAVAGFPAKLTKSKVFLSLLQATKHRIYH